MRPASRGRAGPISAAAGARRSSPGPPTSAGTAPGPVLAGHPLPWLALQLATLGAAAAALTLGIRGHRARASLDTPAKIRLGSLLAGTAVLPPWAAYWGLFTV
ncbi:hypothetical protein [Nocardiopsis baichengensis]|uniref:hypothetical protein n=1 Tax=Nocardiopsis baichengensis TaxID=280240 RepID=UPI000348B4C6|nr:hypothetical protein [Nocardiopsis baichengensis]